MSFRSLRSLRDMYEPLDCDVDALPPSALTVDVLARLELAARRRGRRIRLHNASRELEELVAFMGLAGVLRWASVEAGRQTEEREEPLGVEKRVQTDDPVA